MPAGTLSPVVASPVVASLPVASSSRPGLVSTSSTPRLRSRSPRKTGPLSIAIEKATPESLPALAPRLADIVLACRGESALVAPFTHADAAQLYDLPLGVGPHKCLLLVARTTAVPLKLGSSRREREGGDVGEGEGRKGDVVGSVQLHFHSAPNGWFRADVRGLFVHPDYGRRGVARRLMERLEEEAKACKTKLLVSPHRKQRGTDVVWRRCRWG
jgi:GNAT superfamily N-acetyltransferase